MVWFLFWPGRRAPILLTKMTLMAAAGSRRMTSARVWQVSGQIVGRLRSRVASPKGTRRPNALASTGWIPARVASAKWIPWLPQKNPARQDRDSASLCKIVYFSACCGSGGFQVDSPVKVPVASEMLRCAPPHTFCVGKEPEEGSVRCWPYVVGWTSRRAAERTHLKPLPMLQGVTAVV